jgi:penicillin-binding protein 1B
MNNRRTRRSRSAPETNTHKKKIISEKHEKNINSESNPSILFSFIRGIIFLVVISVIAVFLMTFFLREEVKLLLTRKITEASSIVYSRPFPITEGLSIKKSRVEDRLRRLKYRKVSGIPVKPGEYKISNSSLMVFLKNSWINPEHDQKEGLFELIFNGNNEIQSIIHSSFKTPVSVVWLEPEVLSVLGNSSQRVISAKELNEFSSHLKNAILAIEDEHFYSHFGIDPFSILRAIIKNIQSGRIVQGGSTLTQQLAKNLFFSSDRNIKRKIKEGIAALLIESSHTKDQIFEMYLNEMFLGQEGRFAVHGFGEASLTFFGKDVADITLAEAALLAGLVKAPTSYSPRLNFERTLERQKIVLSRMHLLKMISEEQYEKAKSEKISVYPPARTRRVAPYFVDYLQREVGSLLNAHSLKGGALSIITGLDTEYQSCAETSVNEGISQLEKSYPWLKKNSEKVQASLVSIIPSSGEIRAWVGGRDFGESQFDRVSLAKRQPGSTFKPFVYLTALDGNLNQYRTAKTTSILVDEPVTIPIPGGTWEPKNYDKKYRGEVRLREALAKSLNIPTVQLAEKVGIKNIARTGAYFGFGENLPKVPSLALGAGEVTPLELSQAYSIIANAGVKRTVRPFYHAIDSKSSSVIFTSPIEERRIVDEAPVYLVTDILRSAIENGTGRIVRQLGVKGPVAGKTGTTNEARDSWFVGYTPRILTTVWVGYDSNKILKLTGAQAAAPIWAEYMKCISDFEPELDFYPPSGVIFIELDRESGLLLTEDCPHENGITEVFVSGTEPITPCPLHSRGGQSELKEYLEILE